MIFSENRHPLFGIMLYANRYFSKYQSALMPSRQLIFLP